MGAKLVFPANINGTSVVVTAIAVLHTAYTLLDIGVLAAVLRIACVEGAWIAIGTVHNFVLAEALFVGRLDAIIECANIAIITRRIVRARFAETVVTHSIRAEASATVAGIRST